MTATARPGGTLPGQRLDLARPLVDDTHLAPLPDRSHDPRPRAFHGFGGNGPGFGSQEEVMEGGARHGGEMGTVEEVLGDENADIFDGLAVARGVLDPKLYLPAEHVGAIEVGVVHADVGDAILLDEYVPRR